MQQRFGFGPVSAPLRRSSARARSRSRSTLDWVGMIRSTWRPRSSALALGRDISRLDATRSPGQGEALAWAIWGTTTLAVLVTYSRIDPADTYNVSRDGLAGGLSRALTLVNFPIALVAIALALLATAVLPRAAWWAAAPAIVLCATIPWFVDQDDLDARWVNAIPAVGVLAALGLTVAAVRRAGVLRAPPSVGRRAARHCRRRHPPVAAVDHGRARVSLSRGLLHGRGAGSEKDGTLIAAVHLGHHHGLDGALRALTRCSSPRACRASRAATRRALVPRDDARIRGRQLRPGPVARAGRETRLDGRRHSIGSASWLEADLARGLGARSVATLALLRETKSPSYSEA